MTPICDSWFVLGPVLVLAALAPGQASLADAEVYLLAFAGQLAADACWWLLRDKLLLGGAARGTFQTSLETSRVDATLAPIGFIVGLAAADEPLALLAVAPLIWLLQAFSRERTWRATAPPLSSTAPTTARSHRCPTSSSSTTPMPAITRAQSWTWSAPWPRGWTLIPNSARRSSSPLSSTTSERSSSRRRS